MVSDILILSFLLIIQPIFVSPFLVASTKHTTSTKTLDQPESFLLASSTHITMPSDSEEPKAKKAKKSAEKSEEGGAEVKRNDEGKSISLSLCCVSIKIRNYGSYIINLQ